MQYSKKGKRARCDFVSGCELVLTCALTFFERCSRTGGVSGKGSVCSGDVFEQVGQSKNLQLNTLQPFLEKLRPASDGVYVKNGYTFATGEPVLEEVGAAIAATADYDDLIGGPPTCND